MLKVGITKVKTNQDKSKFVKMDSTYLKSPNCMRGFKKKREGKIINYLLTLNIPGPVSKTPRDFYCLVFIGL